MYITEERLAQEAKRARERAGKTRVEVAEELGVSLEAICVAEDAKAHEEGFEIRCRVLECYAGLCVVGPFYLLQQA